MASTNIGGPTEPPIVVFDPLGANEDYPVPDIRTPGHQNIEAPSIQALVRQPTSLPETIRGLEIILADRYTTDPLRGESKIYLPGCITPIQYQFRVQTLVRNLHSIPKFLDLAVGQQDWSFCRKVIAYRLLPSYLQTRIGINAFWFDCDTHRGAIECEQTCWTALWHVLTTKLLMAGLEQVVPDDRAQRFRTQIDLILAQFILACRGAIFQGDPPHHGPTFELRFHLRMMDLAIAWQRTQYERMALGYQSGRGA